ncbi:MAG: PQQ-dependent sugar dehydrogenase [Acidimicrobiia bacterium]
MTARHREPPTPAQLRLRALIVGLVALFVIAFFFLRDSGGANGPTPTTAPEAAGATSTDTFSPTSTAAGVPTTTDGSPTTETTVSSLPPLRGVSLELVFDGFRQPTVLTAPAGDDRLFVAQRVGVIRILDRDRVMLDPAFLDITDRVLAGGIEQGLLGLAFHPDYASNGRFFVYYTDKGGRRQLSEFRVSTSDPNRALPESERVLFEYEQPPNATDIRHYAGNVAYGPDGYLWVSLGDGADSRRQGQDPNTVFGTIVRIDVDGGDPYAIPPDNPFVDGGGAPEVWAYGLRNPWRFAIDPVDRLIYIADVGHAEEEEVDVVPIDAGGYNFGWADMEGDRCFLKKDCDPADYTSPVVTYTHAEGLSITGGFVYRGVEIPELQGVYFYGDWVEGWVRSFRYVDGQVTEEKDWTGELGLPVGQINTFGRDGFDELYLVTHGGQIYRFTAER